jgi:hypothetical protein
MKKKNISIDDLALMVQNGFEETNKKMAKGFKDVDGRFDDIERLILADHKRRIERLEQEVKELRNLLAVG